MSWGLQGLGGGGRFKSWLGFGRDTAGPRRSGRSGLSERSEVETTLLPTPHAHRYIKVGILS